MTLDDCYEKIQSMSAVSYLVSQYLAAQLYRPDYEREDDVDIHDLTLKCYGIIIGELKEQGVDLVVDWDTALSNGYEADGFVALYTLLHIDYLKNFFITYPDIQDSVRYIFETTDTLNKEELDETFYLESFLDIYKKYNSNDTLLEKIERIEDKVISSYLFKKHILTILDNAVPTTDLSLENISLVSKYVNKIYKGQQIFKNVVEYITTQISSLDKNKLHQAVLLYDLEKVTGQDIVKYAWAVMTDTTTLSDKEKDIQKKIIETHTRHQTHHIEYYLANLIRPTNENIVELVSHHVEEESTKESFFNDIKEMVTLAHTSNIFTKDNIEFIKQLIKIIVPKYYPTGSLSIDISTNKEENI